MPGTNLEFESIKQGLLEAIAHAKGDERGVCVHRARAVAVKAVLAEKSRRWSLEHADFIQAYNSAVESDGLPLDQWRTF